MRELDGMQITGPTDGVLMPGNNSFIREIVSAADTGDRWSFGEVTAELRTPTGGRWIAIWPTRERLHGKRYA
jgi:hypothetical protein